MRQHRLLGSIVKKALEKEETDFQRYMREEPEKDIHEFMHDRFTKL